MEEYQRGNLDMFLKIDDDDEQEFDKIEVTTQVKTK